MQTEKKNISCVVEQLLCTGCLACSVVCPASCITLKRNSEGFPEPHIDVLKCTKCGVCLTNCPANSPVDKNSIIEGRLMASLDKSEYELGASGGIFGAIANQCIRNGYAVYGCAFDSTFRAVHARIDSVQDIARLQGSKYIQSDTAEVFGQVLDDLRNGISVLFCGTPCQVAALRKVSADYVEKLIAIDLVCHGVPSPGFWEEHLKRIEGSLDGKPIRNVQFRTKNMFIRVAHILNIWTDNKHVKIPFQNDVFYYAFLNNISFRRCCYSCKYACPERVSDITLGDCGTLEDFPNFDKVGLGSIVLANTPRGMAVMNELKQCTQHDVLDVSAEIMANTQLRRPSRQPKARADFYSDLRTMDYNDFLDKYLPPTNKLQRLSSAMKSKIPWRLKKKLKNILRK